MSAEMVSLGEVMLRLDPGPGRIRTARAFDVHAGGGEFNVAAALASLGLSTAVVTALPRTEPGVLAASLIRQAGVATDLISWVDDGGTGAQARVGINFTERGFGVRPPLGVSDRAGSAAARMRPGDVDWAAVFGTGVRWLHTGGVFSALSLDTAELVAEAVEAAHRHQVRVSYDVNHRPSLFAALTDRPRHAELVRRILAQVDVLVSNEPEYLLSIGAEAGADASSEQRFERMIADARERFPGIGVFAATRRVAASASANDWSGIAWSAETGLLTSLERPGLEVHDRVGGGDGFTAGIVWGLLDGRSLQDALELGAALGALAMTTPGDVPSASLAEVTELAQGGPMRTIR